MVKHAFGFTQSFKDYIQESIKIDNNETYELYRKYHNKLIEEFSERRKNANVGVPHGYTYWNDPEYQKCGTDAREYHAKLREQLTEKYSEIDIDIVN